MWNSIVSLPDHCLLITFLFQLSLFVRVYLSMTIFASLFKMTAWWPSAGKGTKCMQFEIQKVKNVRDSEAGLMHFYHGKIGFF